MPSARAKQTTKRAKVAVPEYKDVIGKRVNILFEVDDGAKVEFYAGTIRKADTEQEEDGERMIVKHKVEFDDGEIHWFHLAEEEKEGRLEWIDQSTSKKQVTPPSKKQKLSSNGGAKKSTTVLDDNDDDDDDNSGGGGNDDDEISVPDPLPKSIKDVILFMDELEPDQGYYERQKDSRGECSGTRGKLRKFAKKNPDHPGVYHYTQTKKWDVPNKESLFALIELLKTMIK